MATLAFPCVPRPRVSVLMVTYGGWEFISRALQCLLANTAPCYEVIVVDNASPDTTPDRLQREISNARFVFNPVNRGFGPANNQAASLAVAPYLVFLNSDCFVRPGWLPPLLRALKSDKELGAVAPMVLNGDGSLQESGSLLFKSTTQYYGYGDDWGKPEYRFRRSVDYASGACLALRRRTFLDVGGFDVAFAPAYFEDVDLCLRLRRRGLKTLVEPRSVVTHLGGASAGREFTSRWWSRNLLVFMERWRELLDRRPSHVGRASRQRESLWARDSGAAARLLVISERAPSLRGGGDAATYRLLETLAAGWPDCRITVLTPDFLTDPDAFETLIGRGVEVSDGVSDGATWMRERRFHYDAVLFGSGASNDLFTEALNKYQLLATRICGALDLQAGQLAGALGLAGIAPPRYVGEVREPPALSTATSVAGTSAFAVARPIALLILGMHRSGTSALAGCLYHLRVRLGGPLLSANFANEKGYFEHAEIVALHDELLRGLGSSALEPASLPVGWEESPVARAAKAGLRDVIRRSFRSASLWALKDPRICTLLPLWLPLLEEMGVEPRFALMLRSPFEIARSLKARDGLLSWESLELWFRHSVASEAITRGRPRAFVTYDGLLSSPEATLAQLAEGLRVAWPEPLGGANAIRSFLEPSLRHFDKVQLEEDYPPDLVTKVLNLYQAFGDLQGNDNPAADSRIDSLRSACDLALTAFRKSQSSPAAFTSEYNIQWDSLEVRPAMTAGELTTGRAAFVQSGRLPLSGRALSVSYHWLDSNEPSRTVIWDGLRTPVRTSLAPGETWRGEFSIRAPERPGRYVLQVDLVREGVSWFSTRGTAGAETCVQVH